MFAYDYRQDAEFLECLSRHPVRHKRGVFLVEDGVAYRRGENTPFREPCRADEDHICMAWLRGLLQVVHDAGYSISIGIVGRTWSIAVGHQTPTGIAPKKCSVGPAAHTIARVWNWLEIDKVDAEDADAAMGRFDERVPFEQVVKELDGKALGATG